MTQELLSSLCVPFNRTEMLHGRCRRATKSHTKSAAHNASSRARCVNATEGGTVTRATNCIQELRYAPVAQLFVHDVEGEVSPIEKVLHCQRTCYTGVRGEVTRMIGDGLIVGLVQVHTLFG